MSSLGNKEVMAKNIRWYLMSNEKTQKEICKEGRTTFLLSLIPIFRLASLREN